MNTIELETAMREVLTPVAPEQWLIERCCRLAETYKQQSQQPTVDNKDESFLDFYLKLIPEKEQPTVTDGEKVDMSFKEMLTNLFETSWMNEDELETICKAGEMYAAAKVRNSQPTPSDAEIEAAIKKLAKESTAPDQETPDWMECDIRRGMMWMKNRLQKQF